MQFGKEIIDTQTRLEGFGYEVVIPKDVEEYASNKRSVESKWDKIEGDLIKDYYEEIKKCDSLLVINITKHGIENYVGGNSLIELAEAYVLGKKVFLLNPIPEMQYSDEIAAMNPTILSGDLSLIS